VLLPGSTKISCDARPDHTPGQFRSIETAASDRLPPKLNFVNLGTIRLICRLVNLRHRRATRRCAVGGLARIGRTPSPRPARRLNRPPGLARQRRVSPRAAGRRPGRAGCSGPPVRRGERGRGRGPSASGHRAGRSKPSRSRAGSCAAPSLSRWRYGDAILIYALWRLDFGLISRLLPSELSAEAILDWGGPALCHMNTRRAPPPR
jgi:hypothetical protein